MADRVIRTTVEMSGEESYSKKMKAISAEMKNVASAQKAVNAQYGRDGNSMTALTAKQGVLQDKMEVQKKKLAAIKEEYEKVSEAQGENSEAAQRLATAYNNASADLARTENDLADVQEAMGKAGEAAEKSADKVNKSKDAWKKIGETVSKTAEKMAKAMGAVVTAAVTAGVKGFLDYEQGVAKVGTLMDKEVMSVEQMGDAILEASDKTGMAATDLTESVYTALSSGVGTGEVVGFIETAAKAAKAGFADIDTVVDGSTSAINAWGMAYSDANKVFDAMIVAQNEGKTTLGDLAKNIGKVTGVAPQLGISFNEVLAAVAALTKNGVGTEQAFTGLKAVMSNVLKPTAEASKAAKKLGIDFSVAALQSKGLTGFLADVMEKTGGDAEQLARLFGSVEGLSQVMLLGGAAAEDYSHALASMGEGGAMDAAFDEVSNTRAEKFNKSINQMKNNAIKLGQSLAPYIDMVADAFDKLADKISAMSKGDMLKLLNTAMWATGAMAAVGALGKIKAALELVNVAGGLMSGPAGWITLAIAGIAALVALVMNSTPQMSTFGEALAAGMDDVELSDAKKGFEIGVSADVTLDTPKSEIESKGKELCDEIVDALTDGIPDTPEVMEDLQSKVETYFGDVADKVNEWAEGEISKLDPMSDTYKTDCETIKTQAAEMVAALETQEQKAMEWIQSMAGKSAEYVKQHVGELEQILGMVIDITDKINEATGNTKTMDLVKRGLATSSEMGAQAFGEASAKRTQGLADNKQAFLDKQDFWSDLMNRGIIDEDAYKRVIKGEQERMEAANAEVEAEYQKDIAELMHGLIESTDLLLGPEEKAALDKAFGEGQLLDTNWQLLDWDKMTEGQKAAMEAALKDADITEITAEEFVKGMGDWDPDLINDVWSEMESNFKEGFDPNMLGFIPEVIQTMIEQGVFKGVEGLEGLDVGQILMKLWGGGEGGEAPKETVTVEAEGDVTKLTDEIGKVDGTTVTASVDGDPSELKNKIEAFDGKKITIKTEYKSTTPGFARGGRATSASIFGEAGAEWAIPEKHNKRTAELLMAAINATGFSFAELARTAGTSANLNTLNAAMAGMRMQAQELTRGRGMSMVSGGETMSGMGGAVVAPSRTTNVSVTYSGAFTRSEAWRFGSALTDAMNTDVWSKGGQ